MNKDGMLDYEEMCIALHLIYRCLDGEPVPLTLNAQLSAAAKAHAADMLCYNYLSHTGFDSSTPETRVTAQGFTASLVVEDIYASKTGNPQAALDWWMSDPAHRADILNANTTVFGIAYVTSADSMLGGYFVVLSAKP